MKKVLFGLIIATLIFTGCGSKQSSGELLQIDLTAKSFASGQVEIVDEIELIEYVPLELTDESLIANILDMCVSDEYIFIYSTRQDGILQFDRKGHYLRTVAKTGNGPGETGQNVPWMFSLGIFNWATDDTIVLRPTIGNMNLMSLEETSLKAWIYNGSMDGWFCYSEGTDTVWNVNAKTISPAFLIDNGYSASEEKEMRSSKTGNASVDGTYGIFNIFETPRSYFVKCFQSSDQSKFFLYSLDKATGALSREASTIDGMELFKYNRALTGIGIRNETDGGLPVWPYFSYPAKKLMIQFNTAVEIEYLKEKYPDLKKHPVLQEVTEDSNPLVTIYHLR